MSELDDVEVISRISVASSLQEIADLCFVLFGNPVFIIDTANNVLAHTKKSKVDDPAWQGIEKKNYFSKKRIWKSEEVRSVNADSLHKQGPILVEDNYIPYPRLIKTIAAKGGVRGSIILTAYLHPFSEKDIMILNIISSFVFFLMDSSPYQSGDFQNELKYFFVKLLDGADVSNDQVNEQLETYQFYRNKNYYVLNVEFQNQAKPDDTSLEPLIRGFDRENCFAFMYDYSLLCIYGTDHEISDWRKQEQQLCDHLCLWNLSAGISRCFSEIAQLKSHYMQARNARRIGTMLGRSGNIFVYDDYAFYEMLQELPYTCHLANYCNQKILALNQYDKKKKTELCRTLQIYLDNDKNLNRTAELMYLNRNTIRYRIQKCMEFLDVDLDDKNTNFSFLLSFRMLEFEQKLTDTLSRTGNREFRGKI